MEQKKQNKRKQIVIWAVLLLAYLIWNGVLLMRHELWRDEANVWLMARELSPIQLLKEIKYQGHPCLWYLLMMPFAKLGFPFQTISIVSYLVMGAAAGLFLAKAPFSVALKAGCLFSPIFTYYYAVIARNYCLIALFLVLLAVFYPERNRYPIRYGLLLGLLVQSDIIALPAAGMISLMWLCENRGKEWKGILKGIWIPLASFVLLILQFVNVSDSPVFGTRKLGIKEFFYEIKGSAYWILERLTGQGQNFAFLFLVFSLIGIFLISIKVKNFWASAVMISAYLFEAVFSVVIYQLHIWHFIALCFVLLWTLWILHEQTREKGLSDNFTKGILLSSQGMVLLLAVCMLGRWNSEEESSNLANALHGSYSDGVYTADFIRDHISAEAPLITASIPFTSTIAAYLPEYQFYFAGNGMEASYADWSKAQSQTIEVNDMLAWAKKAFPDQEYFYLIDAGESCLVSSEKLKDYQIIYQSPEQTARGEEYTIYQITKGE